MRQKSTLFQTLAGPIVLFAAILLPACTSYTTGGSKTTSGATKGAVAGAVVGGVVGHQSGETGEGIAIGAVSGLVIGGVLGAIKEAKIQREQDALAQERSYQQELAKQRKAAAEAAATHEREMAISAGLRISDRELAEAVSRAREVRERLATLKAKRDSAISRKKALEEAETAREEAEEEIRQLEKELSELELKEF